MIKKFHSFDRRALLTKAVYPGSFDPITLGHEDIIGRIADVFDEVHVLVAEASHKQALFTMDERVALVKTSVGHLKNVKVTHHPGLTVDYAKKIGAKVLIRGVRAISDFEYEMNMAAMNQKLNERIDTVIFLTKPELSFVSSKLVKEVAVHQGSLKGLVSAHVEKEMSKKIRL